MDKEVQHILEYDKLRLLLRDEASSSWGRELVENLHPSADREEIEGWLAETAEAAEVLSVAAVPLGGFHDIRPFLTKAQKGALLDVDAILAILETLYAMRQVKRFFKELPAEAPILKAWARCIEIQGQLERNLENTFDEHGQIRDDATPELLRIRRGVQSAKRRIKGFLNGVLHDPAYKKVFQDAIITVREDRYVIPVRQEYRQAFPGIIHDQSSTGATLFIEPMTVVELNNEAKKLALAEQQEVMRILRALSVQIASSAGVLRENAALLARFDFTFAKAKFARRLRAVRPLLNTEGRTVLKSARHPLLPSDRVVPIDLFLGAPHRMLLVTGPNTGGKTVSMKTVGLLSLMAQSGCFIPAAFGSELAIYQHIYADIGDEQSIEQSLSTFSAHMKNLVDILAEVEENDLLLIDEIGAGTDPEEGAALAMAILERLRQINVSVMATTHYSALKTFAYTQQGIENASVEFDVDTLRPTYRLLIGIPGASNAFAISARLGLSKSLVLRGQELMEADHAKFEQVVNALEKEKRLYEERSADIAERQRRAARLEEKWEKMRQELLQQKTEILRKARSESAAMIRRARREAEETIQALKAQFHDQGSKKRQQVMQDVRDRLADAAERTKLEFSSHPAYREKVNLATLQIGDTVYVPSLDQKGEVTGIRGKALDLLLGQLKTTVKSDACRFVSRGHALSEDAAPRQNSTSVFLDKTATARREIDIRGMMVDEGEQTVGKFLDDASLSGLKQVLIIHGKGTGALRKGIHAYLRRHKSVSGFQFADMSDGGTGATTVELR
ncbi:MAG: endonuclease MutS2 [Schwartzia sp. (in: firmicutes)]